MSARTNLARGLARLGQLLQRHANLSRLTWAVLKPRVPFYMAFLWCAVAL